LRSYLGSKFTVLGMLAIAQTILITISIIIGFTAPNPTLIPWPIGIFISTLLTLTASFCLGLLVSVAVKNQSQANGALPLLLLPQIIFSGVLFKLQGLGTLISWLMLSRWAMASYGTVLNVNQLATAYSPPTESAYDATWGNLLFNWLMLLTHIAIYLGITTYLQKRKDVI
jgi:ABC transport system ATP-binding/permease protein